MTKPTVSASPLPGLPAELFVNIMKYLGGDKRTLLAAIHVNKAWWNEAATFLWQHMKHASHRVDAARCLAGVADPHRRQLYANKIRSLDLFFSIHTGVMDGLQFPRVETIDVNDSNLRLDQYIQSNLQMFALHGGCSINSLELLADRCINLKTLIILAEVTNARPEVLKRILRQCRKIEVFTVGREASALVDEETLVSLVASQGRLSHSLITAGKLMSTVKLVDALQAIPPQTLGPSLRSLTIHMESAGAATLLPSMQSLTSLCLHVLDSRAFQSVAKIECLRFLTLIFRQNALLSPEDFSRISDLCHLSALTISHTQGILANATLITDAQFYSVVSSLGELTDFKFKAGNRLTGAALLAIGASCKQLSMLEIYGRFIMFDWHRFRGPLFPALERFCISDMVAPPQRDETLVTTAQSIAKLMARHMPRLEAVFCYHEEGLAEEVFVILDQDPKSNIRFTFWCQRHEDVD